MLKHTDIQHSPLKIYGKCLEINMKGYLSDVIHYYWGPWSISIALQTNDTSVLYSMLLLQYRPYLCTWNKHKPAGKR